LSERITRCLVPGCGRTTRRFPDVTEWICAEHWRAVNRKLRRRLFRNRRRVQKYGDADAWRRHQLIWSQIREQAILRAMGL